MKLSIINESGLDRRNFLKRFGAAAAAASTGDAQSVTGQLTNIVDPLGHISDAELTTTPEEEWINKIPISRLHKIIQNDPEYAGMEIMNKLVTAIRYGTKEAHSGKIARILLKAVKQLNINPFQGDFVELAASSTLNDGSYDQKLRQRLIDVASKLGIPNDVILSLDRNCMRMGNQLQTGPAIEDDEPPDPSDEWTEQQYGKTKSKTKTQQLDDKYHIPADYHLASAMHQPFEQKLSNILAKLII